MDNEILITPDKGEFMTFLETDYNGKILELLNSDGIELLRKFKYTEERINYILCYSKYCNELIANNNFLDLFLSVDTRSCYGNLYLLNNDSYDRIINRCFELNKDNKFIGELFSHFNSEYKLNAIDNNFYSEDLIYEIFKNDLETLGPKIMQKYDIDFMSHNINMKNIFNRGKTLAFKEFANKNNNYSKVESIFIPEDKITKKMAKSLWENSDVFEYRNIINEASYSCNPHKLNEYAKDIEDNTIVNAKENGLIESIDKIFELTVKLSKLTDFNEKREFVDERAEIITDNRFYKIAIDISKKEKEGLDKVFEFLEEESNKILSNYIIDYHFEENYFNIMYDMRELLNFYYAGNINIPEDRLYLYDKLVHLDELPIIDKKELYEELKKYNMIELFYDDMSFARKIVRESIKDYSLVKDEMIEYKDEELSKEYGIDVYNIKDNPFFAIVKTGRAAPDKLPTGHSYSIVGSGCIGTFGHAKDSDTFVYDSANLNSDQIVHVYPMDSYTLYKPFVYSKEATSRRQYLMMPDELLEQTNSYNEILILEQGTIKNDMDKKIPELKKMALYCLDKITQKDIEVAKANGVGIFLVSTKDYHKGYEMPSSIYRHSDNKRNYWSYDGDKDYFDGVSDKEIHERNRK